MVLQRIRRQQGRVQTARLPPLLRLTDVKTRRSRFLPGMQHEMVATFVLLGGLFWRQGNGARRRLQQRRVRGNGTASVAGKGIREAGILIGTRAATDDERA